MLDNLEASRGTAVSFTLWSLRAKTCKVFLQAQLSIGKLVPVRMQPICSTLQCYQGLYETTRN
ncbi:hypothetical protein AC579_2907 [Pseudocercospora musae]|uniref:Uncharacterized protein n=1 Tax=Pseudocercospora musae TaxID=113226 RepID=A0A139IUN0_9PEZI|nr:hypothetical protein AC579_2907 [Pseudocercospora musae]